MFPEKRLATAWGNSLAADNFGQNHLMSVGVPIVSDADCRSAKGFHDQKITGRMLCAGYLDGSMDACTVSRFPPPPENLKLKLSRRTNFECK